MHVHSNLQAQNLRQGAKYIDPFLLERGHAMRGYWYSSRFGFERGALSSGGKGGKCWCRGACNDCSVLTVDHNVLVFSSLVGGSPARGRISVVHLGISIASALFVQFSPVLLDSGGRCARLGVDNDHGEI